MRQGARSAARHPRCKAFLWWQCTSDVQASAWAACIALIMVNTLDMHGASS